jgi:uncharacterized SAM-binding protein YcdF (DUF218 family)
LLRDEQFALVTNAMHMPRALMTFKRHNLHPLPAPVSFTRFPESRLIALWPSKQGLYVTDIALHEYVGMLWLLIRGQYFTVIGSCQVWVY